MNLVGRELKWAAVGLGPGDKRGRRVLPVRQLGSLWPGFFQVLFGTRWPISARISRAWSPSGATPCWWGWAAAVKRKPLPPGRVHQRPGSVPDHPQKGLRDPRPQGEASPLNKPPLEVGGAGRRSLPTPPNESSDSRLGWSPAAVFISDDKGQGHIWPGPMTCAKVNGSVGFQ